MSFSGLRLARVFGVASLGLFFAGLLFRFAVYRHMYIASGDPYGISDIIEFFLGWALLITLAVAALIGLVLLVKGPRANRVAAAWLFVTCASIAVLLVPLHNLAAKWAL